MKPTEVQRRIAEIEECLDDNKCPTNTPRVLERALEALKALAPPADLAPVAAAIEWYDSACRSGVVEAMNEARAKAFCACFAYCRALIATPASNPVSKVEGGEAVAWVNAGDLAVLAKVGGGSIYAATKPDPDQATPLYTHPTPPALSAVELDALERCEKAWVVPKGTGNDIATICAALRSRATQPAVRQGAVGSYPVATQPAVVGRANRLKLESLEAALVGGGFYADYDASWRHIAELRTVIAALAPGGG